MSPALCPPARLGLQESSLTTPLVYVASGPHEVGLWDVEQSKCHQVVVQANYKHANCGGSLLLPPTNVRFEVKAEGCEHDLLGRSRYISVRTRLEVVHTVCVLCCPGAIIPTAVTCCRRTKPGMMISEGLSWLCRCCGCSVGMKESLGELNCPMP